MRRFVALALLVMLAGCTAGPPITLLRLAPTKGRPITAITNMPITVAAVEIPPTIDRLALTVETGESTVHVSRNARWAAPLGEMSTQVFAEDLAARLPHASVLMPGEEVPPGGAWVVRIDMTRFVPVWGTQNDHVALDAAWQVLSPKGTVLTAGRSQIRVSGRPDAASAAQSMSAALGELADRVAAALHSG